jgi:amino acid transporter
VTAFGAKAREGLHRVLGRGDVLALAFGAMIGWSWVLLTGEWIVRAGSLGAIVAFLIGGVVVVFIALTYAELAAAMPSVGGEHVYSLRALGRGLSFVCSWSIVLGYVSVAAFEAVALPYALSTLVPGTDLVYLWTVAGWDVHLSFVAIGIAAAAVLTWINILGVRPAATMQGIVTLAIVASGVYFLAGVSMSGDPDNLQPLFESFAGGGLFAVLMMVPIMFVGFDIIPQTAEEIDLPHAQIGALVVMSVIVAVLWYVAIIFGVGLSLDAPARAASGMTTADAAGAAWGSASAREVLIIGGIAGIVTTWNAFLLGSSRLVYALASSGMLPAILARLHPRYGTPHVALLAIGAVVCLAPWFGRPILVWLINAGSFGVIIAYMMVAASFLVLRRREPDMPRPYRVRHGGLVGGAALGLSGALMLLYLPGGPAGLAWPHEWIICLAWAAAGGVLYFSCAAGRRDP